MDALDAADRYLILLQPRFEESGYRWERDISSAYVAPRCVAELRRTRLVALHITQILFVFTPIDTLTPSLLAEYVLNCTRFAWHERRHPADQTSCIVPVALFDEATPAARSALLEHPPSVRPLRGQSVLPAAYDLERGELLISKRRRLWHAVVWRPLQRIVLSMLTP